MSFFSIVITVSVLVLGCSARNLGKRGQDEYTRLMTGMSRYDVFHDECGAAVEDRQTCGTMTYDEDECRLRGCCYETCPGCDAQVPWCFLAKRMLSDEDCQVAYEDKDDCGYYGITEAECVQVRGCCWAPSPLDNDPPCFRKKAEITTRLVDGAETRDSLTGRVEVKHDGQWGTVCDDNFDQRAAEVLCRSLGYEFAIPYGNAEFGEGSSDILLDGMRCRGDEDKLEDCPHNGWGSHDCGHYEDAGAKCSNNEQTIPDYEDNEHYYPDYYTEYPDYYYPDYEDYYDPYEYDEDEEYEYGGDDEEYPWYRLGGRKGGKNGKNGFKGGKKRPEKTAHHISKRSADKHRMRPQRTLLRPLAAKLLKKGLAKEVDGQPRHIKSNRVQHKTTKAVENAKNVDGQPRQHHTAHDFALKKRGKPFGDKSQSMARKLQQKKAMNVKIDKDMKDKKDLVKQLKAARKAALAKKSKVADDVDIKH